MSKPVKPSNCPPGLYPHKRGWCMRIPGKKSPVCICGNIPFDQVLAKFYQKKAEFHAIGSTAVAVAKPLVPVPIQASVPAAKEVGSGSMSVADLKDRYLKCLEGRKEVIGDYSKASLVTARRELARFAEFFPNQTLEDLVPADFMKFRLSMGKISVNSVSRMVTNVRTMFNWAADNEVISSLPRWGKSFEKPDASQLRKHVNQKRDREGGKKFKAGEIKKILDKADTLMRALILLGLNGGFGNEDLSSLPMKTLHLADSVISYSRPKSGFARRVPLWPETKKALDDWLNIRPIASSKDNDKLLFLTSAGTPLIQYGAKSHTDLVSVKFRHLAKSAGVWRHGFGFYTFRHTFRTAARPVSDQMAVNFIMGHASGPEAAKMAETYIEGTDDAVLRRITDHVRLAVLGEWLGIKGNSAPTPAPVVGDDLCHEVIVVQSL